MGIVMNEIEQWLNGPKDYNEGVQLFSKYGKNKTLIKRLSRSHPTTRNRLTLEHHLKKLKAIPTVEISTAESITKSTKKPWWKWILGLFKK